LPTFTRRSRTCPHSEHRATIPGHFDVQVRFCEIPGRPQLTHCPCAAVKSTAKILFNSPAPATIRPRSSSNGIEVELSMKASETSSGATGLKPAASCVTVRRSGPFRM
jgi:hypothetical protein